MNYINEIIIWIFCILIFLFYYKSSLQKLLHPYAYIILIQQYNLLSNKLWVKYLSPIFIILEILSGIWVLIPSTRLLGCFVGITIQIYSIIIMIRRFGVYYKSSCGCFELNFPQKITFKHLLLNIGIIFGFLIIISFTKEMGRY